MKTVLIKALLVCAVVLGALVVTFVPRHQARAAASVDLVTQGNVEAVFNANRNAKDAILNHAHHLVAFFEDRLRIRISPLSSHNGQHFCVDDWHLMQVTYFNVVDNAFLFTDKQVVADLQATTITLTLDGVTLSTSRTPVTQIVGSGSPPVFDFSTGRIFSPADIGVGDHSAGITISDPAYDPTFGMFQDSSTFTVDPSGTGICLQP